MAETVNKNIDVLEEKSIEKESESHKNKKQEDSLTLFKNCSLSLKRLSLLTFILNLLLIGLTAFAAIILIGVYLGTEMITLLIVPVISVIVILVIFARLISALIYGFAEIVEKHEKED